MKLSRLRIPYFRYNQHTKVINGITQEFWTQPNEWSVFLNRGFTHRMLYSKTMLGLIVKIITNYLDAVKWDKKVNNLLHGTTRNK